MKNGIVTNKEGDKYWYKDGFLHREGGPAVEEVGGFQKWCLNGVVHREDGPALIYSNGISLWFIRGEYLTSEEIDIAERIISGVLFNQIPLYINHPRLKYFCHTVLSRNKLKV